MDSVCMKSFHFKAAFKRSLRLAVELAIDAKRARQRADKRIVATKQIKRRAARYGVFLNEDVEKIIERRLRCRM